MAASRPVWLMESNASADGGAWPGGENGLAPSGSTNRLRLIDLGAEIVQHGPDHPIVRSFRVASFKDLFKSDVAKGVAIGVGIVALSPMVAPVMAKLSRPAARATARTGSVFYEKGLETLAEMGEILEDFAAEVKAEFAHMHEQARAETPESAAVDQPAPAADTASLD